MCKTLFLFSLMEHVRTLLQHFGLKNSLEVYLGRETGLKLCLVMIKAIVNKKAYMQICPVDIDKPVPVSTVSTLKSKD